MKMFYFKLWCIFTFIIVPGSGAILYKLTKEADYWFGYLVTVDLFLALFAIITVCVSLTYIFEREDNQRKPTTRHLSVTADINDMQSRTLTYDYT